MMDSENDDLDCRWPAATDRAFVEVDPRDGANAAYDTNERLYRMRRGFRMAADLLVERAQQERHLRKELLYPILFAYRQALELELKYVPIAFGAYLEDESSGFRSEGHDLEQLWSRWLRVFAFFGSPVADETPSVEAVIREFNAMDPSSDKFRFSHSPAGEPLTLPIACLDLAKLRETMAGVFDFLECGVCVLRDGMDLLPLVPEGEPASKAVGCPRPPTRGRGR